jgi:serine-aspartate repeat-containing protein C/D/E
MTELPKRSHQWATRCGLLFVLAIAAVFPQATLAALLGNTLNLPYISFDNQGTTTYDAGTNQFSVDATPLALLVSGSPPATITGTESFLINITVDNAGSLLGGIPGGDLVVIGDVTVPGLGFKSGVLLTGEVTGFGFQDSGGTTDSYDFTFVPTGGLLTSLYPGTLGVGVSLTSEQSNFTGDFSVDFAGEAKGTLGELVPIPSAVWLFGSGLLGLVGIARRKKA